MSSPDVRQNARRTFAGCSGFVLITQHNTTQTPHSTAVDGSVKNSGLCVRAVDMGDA